MFGINKDLIHAILVNCCSDDVTRRILTEPFARGKNAYASDGRLCVRYVGAEGVAKEECAAHGTLSNRIDEYLHIDGKTDQLFEVTDHTIEYAAYTAMADVLQCADREPDLDGHTFIGEDVEVYSLVRIGGKFFRALYLRKIIDALRLLGLACPLFYLKNDALIVHAGNIAFALMSVREVSDNSASHAIVDGANGEFVHHRSSWMA